MYRYEDERPSIFTEDGQVMFLQIRDRADALIKEAGAVRLAEAIAKTSGSSWRMIACIDRLVELGELRELTMSDCAGQDRVFVRYWGRTSNG